VNLPRSISCLFVMLALGLHPAAAAEPAIKTIGIISATGDKLAVTSIGVNAATSSQRTIETDDWLLGTALTDAFTTALSPHYDVHVISPDAPEFDLNSKKPLDIVGPVRRLLATGEWKFDETNAAPSDFVAATKTYLKPGDPETYDAYLVIYPAERGDSIGGSGRMLKGIGLYRHPSFADSSTHLFTACKVALIDGHSLTIRAEAWLQLPRPGPDEVEAALTTGLTLDMEPEPNEFAATIGDAAWPASGNDVEAPQQEAIETSFKTLIGQEAPYALRELKLAN
jgi:hypothetical protein